MRAFGRGRVDEFSFELLEGEFARGDESSGYDFCWRKKYEIGEG